MSKRFTIAQYQYIVAQQEEYFPVNVVRIGISNRTLNDVYLSLDKKFNNVISGKIEDAKNKFLALFNPVSRDFVKDSLVEADSLFLWSYNAPNGVEYNLNTLVVDGEKRIFLDEDDATPITFSEVKKQMGDLFNIDLFDRIEVSNKPNKGEEGF